MRYLIAGLFATVLAGAQTMPVAPNVQIHRYGDPLTTHFRNASTRNAPTPAETYHFDGAPATVLPRGCTEPRLISKPSNEIDYRRSERTGRHYYAIFALTVAPKRESQLNIWAGKPWMAKLRKQLAMDATSPEANSIQLTSTNIPLDAWEHIYGFKESLLYWEFRPAICDGHPVSFTMHAEFDYSH